MAIPSDDSDLHLTLFAGAFAPHGVCETAQDVVEELNGLPLGRLGPRIQYMVRYLYWNICYSGTSYKRHTNFEDIIYTVDLVPSIGWVYVI